MFAKPNHWIFVLLTVLFLVTVLTWPGQVSASQATTPVSNSCLTCHEDLYYLHDTGKWYCITKHGDHCVDCHAGNPAVQDKLGAHAGLISHPQRNNGERCQECHPQDLQERLEKFAALGGCGTIQQVKAYVPPSPEPIATMIVPETAPLVENRLLLAGGIFVFGAWLLLVLLSPLKP